jgi:hypothetical protein
MAIAPKKSAPLKVGTGKNDVQIKATKRSAQSMADQKALKASKDAMYKKTTKSFKDAQAQSKVNVAKKQAERLAKTGSATPRSR